MPFLKTEDGWIHINMGRQPRKRCHFCPRWADKLCDFPVGPGKKTCDASICERCATKVGEDLDHCPRHRHMQAPPVQGGLFQ